MLRRAAIVAALLAWAVPCSGGQDEEAVEKAVRAALSGASAFADTRDKGSVLKWYAKDYHGIQDGEWEDLTTVERWLSAYEDELKKGSTVRYDGEAKNVAAHVTGDTAWATYEYVFRMSDAGEVTGQDVGKCTVLLRKEGAGWLILHEHCSQKRAEMRP